LLKIAITGSTGMVGERLVQSLTEQGNEIYRVVRSQQVTFREPTIAWDPDRMFIDKQQLEGMDVVIHLAGAPIHKRWTKRQKEKIISSRVQTTELLSQTFAQLKHPPRCLLSASAIGYYGNQPFSRLLDETSEQGSGFLADLVQQWEAATTTAVEAGIRVVLDRKAGALPQIVTPFRWGLGGKLGTGRQTISWVTLDEVPAIIEFLLAHEEIKGAVNVVSPEPVTNYRFTKILGDVLQRPTIFTFPAWLLKLVFGARAEELMCAGNRVAAKKLLDAGYSFHDKDLRQTLEKIFTKSSKKKVDIVVDHHVSVDGK
jgi:uncharacterized protein (TIGR01777 family)